MVSVVVAITPQAVATPQPWQWTPRKLEARLRTTTPRSIGLPAARTARFKDARCVGRGQSSAGRFSSFRCTTRITPRVGRVALWVRLRPVGPGSICGSLRSLSAISATCLRPAPSVPATGVAADAKQAVRLNLAVRLDEPHFDAMIVCSGGPTTFKCTFENAGERGTAVVTFTAKGPVVEITSLECLTQKERPGCSLESAHGSAY